MTIFDEQWSSCFQSCPSCPELLKFCELFFCIPGHNANDERAFSLINAQCMKQRNRLTVDSVRGILLTKHNFKKLFCMELLTLPRIDIIGAMVIVRRVRGKIIRSVLCNIVCNNCAQCSAHTWTDLTVLWIGFCVTGPISLCLDSFLCMYCITACMCRLVTRWGGPGGIEAYS